MKSIPFLDIDPRYFRYLWPYGLLITITLLMMLLNAAISIATPWPLKYIIDHIIGEKPWNDPFGQTISHLLNNNRTLLAADFGLLMVIIATLGGLCNFAQAYLQGIVQSRTTFRLRSDAFAHIQALSLRFHDRNRTGEIISRVNNDAEKVMEALVTSTGEFFISSFRIIGTTGVMFLVNWKLALIALCYIPILLLLLHRFRRRIKTSVRAVRNEEGHMLTVTYETISAIRVVQAFGREHVEQQRFDHHGSVRMAAELRARRWEALFSPLIESFKALGTAVIVWVGVLQVSANQLTVGELLVFLSYLTTFYDPLQKFSKLANGLQKAAVSGARLAELFDNDAVIMDVPQAQSLDRVIGNIAFQHVSFSYDDMRAVLCNVSFEAHPGQKIGLVGPTGSGKTTLSNLLLRFYDVSYGTILMDGIDIRNIRLSDLRRQIALVSQEPILFATSIRDNIAYGRPSATMPDIIASAQAANAHEFITQLPHGYDTIIGERGATLSGGQRQRIAIARALLCDAPILILDEPTAALDAKSEYEVMTALERLMHGRTTFIIAHRLATIRNADMILVFERGRVVERGQHTDLLKRNGRYAELVQLQETGKLTEPVLTLSASHNNKIGYRTAAF